LRTTFTIPKMRHSNVTGRIRVVKPNYPYSCGRDTELMHTACRMPTDTDTDTDTELAYIILGLVRPRTVGCLAKTQPWLVPCKNEK